MQITTVMVVIFLIWGTYTLFHIGWDIPPFSVDLKPEALGWLKNSTLPYRFIPVAVAIGLGHSLLAMSGEETFAQVSREIAHPKVKNLKRAAMLMFVFSFIFTTSVSFLAVMIIPDDVRPKFFDNLISGVVLNFVGPLFWKLLFQGFVVIVGFLILSGAANTALIGSNALLNRLSEDGVLPDWLRKPHHKYGTSYRILNILTVLQLITIVISRGDVYLIGEAYAFGVLWSFFFQALAVTVLRYRDKTPREWKFPINLHIGRLEIPIGLLTTLFILLAVALANLFTKQVATISGVSFTLLLFVIFSVSERWRKKQISESPIGRDPFRIVSDPEITRTTVGCKPHNILVPIIESKDLSHLDAILKETDTKKQDVVVMTTHLLKAPTIGQAEDPIFAHQEQELFTHAVKLAEKHGKSVRLVVTSSNDTFFSIAQTAFRLDSESIVLRVSPKLSPLQQAKGLSEAWDKIPNAGKKDILIRIWRDGKTILDWNALPPLPDIPRETLRGINYLYRELNPEGTEQIARSRIIEIAIDRLVQEYKAGQFTWTADQKR